MIKSQCLLCFFSFFLTASVLAAPPMPLSNEDVKQTEVYKRAQEGDAKAQFELASLYSKTKDVDYPTVVLWLRRSGAQGNLEAQYALGRIYHQGKPKVPVDLKEAEIWYKKAAVQGDKQAIKQLDILHAMPAYQLESPPSIDEKWEIDWLEKTASYGDAQSQYELGRLYQDGIKIPMNYSKALAWYYQAAQKDHLEAMCALGYLYLEGKGTEANIEKALFWYEKAAQDDYYPAERKLAEIYASDRDRTPDYEKAYQWLYLSLSYIFPNQKNLRDVSPDLQTLEKKMTPAERERALNNVLDFMMKKRPHAPVS